MLSRTMRLVGAVVLASTLGGCYGAGEAIEADEASDPISLEEARSQSWESLLGAWRGTSGPFTGLVFTRQTQRTGRHFFADVDTGIRCITTPCPSSARMEGYFTAGSVTVTLRHPDRPSVETAPFFGRYDYTLRGNTLTLSQRGRVIARLSKATSYCAEADDCGEQSLITPRCLGAFTCRENACVYRCGPRDCSTMRCDTGYFCQMIDDAPTCLSNCARMRCTANTTCRNTPTGAQCVPNGPSCALIRCASGTTCVETDGVGQCVPNGPGCAAIRCASGTTCVETNGVGQCVPNAGPRCGTITCPSGQTCCNPLRNICTPPGFACIQ
ncbi:MAG: hypothetical protein JNK72_08520 [Myxococcales bacterium]|nr:hypothetical protein [Myxococcales bacterium]